MSSIVLDVSLSSIVPSNFVVEISLEWSHGSVLTRSELVVDSVGESIVSLLPGSDRVGSSIKDEPLTSISWMVVSDSEVVLVRSEVARHEQSSMGGHS